MVPQRRHWLEKYFKWNQQDLMTLCFSLGPYVDRLTLTMAGIKEKSSLVHLPFCSINTWSESQDLHQVVEIQQPVRHKPALAEPTV